MELTNEFTVDRPVDETWKVLTDVERIAPALPGAQLQEIEGDEYRGIVKVKVGPITAQYKGKATFVEKDDTNHKAVLKAEGRDTKGQGNASALITASLVPDGRGTKVTVHTDLTVTGKVAQFGRGIMADVSTKLLNQFVENLETNILAGDAGKPESAAETAAPTAAAPAAEAAPRASDAGPTIRRLDHPEPEPVNLIDHARRTGREADRAARDRRPVDLPLRARHAPPASPLGGRRRGRHRAPRTSASVSVRGGGTRRPWPSGRDPQRAVARRRHADAHAVLVGRQGRGRRRQPARVTRRGAGGGAGRRPGRARQARTSAMPLSATPRCRPITRGRDRRAVSAAPARV